MAAKRKLKTSKKGKTKKYQLGGLLEGLADSAVATGGEQLAGGLVDAATSAIFKPNKYGIQPGAAGILGSAAKGFATAGPLGLLAAAPQLGQELGLWGKSAKEKTQELQNTEMSNALTLQKTNSDAMMANYNNKGTGQQSFKNGGELSLMPIPGGHQKQIANDAVEVKGNPNVTDGIEIAPQTFVDHNEVLRDRGAGIQVFSDKLGFSKKAKKLIRQKNESSPLFKEANERIEGKLDELFAEQQALNGNSQGESVNVATVPGEVPGAGYDPVQNPNANMFQEGGHLELQQGLEKIYNRVNAPRPTSSLEQKSQDLQNLKLLSKDTDPIKPISPDSLKMALAAKLKEPRLQPTLKGVYSPFQKREIDSLLSEYRHAGIAPPPKMDLADSVLNQNMGPVNIPDDQAFRRQPREEYTPSTGYNTKSDTLNFSNRSNTPLNSIESSDARETVNNAIKNVTTPEPKFAGNEIWNMWNGAPTGPKIATDPNPELTTTSVPATTKPVVEAATPAVGPKSTVINPPKIDSLKPRIKSFEAATLAQSEKAKSIGEANIKESLANITRNFKPKTGNEEDSRLGDVLEAATQKAIVNKTPLPNMPKLQKNVRLGKVNAADRINEIRRQGRAARLAAARGNVSGQTRQGSLGNITGQQVAQANSVFGDVARQNVGITNQQALTNQAIAAQNTGAINNYGDQLVNRTNAINRMDSKLVADMYTKQRGYKSEQNQKDYMLKAIDLLRKGDVKGTGARAGLFDT